MFSYRDALRRRICKKSVKLTIEWDEINPWKREDPPDRAYVEVHGRRIAEDISVTVPYGTTATLVLHRAVLTHNRIWINGERIVAALAAQRMELKLTDNVRFVFDYSTTATSTTGGFDVHITMPA